MTGAAIFQEERHHLAKAVEAGAVDDGPALPLRRNQVRPLQRRQMGRHGIVGHAEQPGDFTGGQSIGFMGDEQPEGIQTRGLGESRKGIDGAYIVHMSRLIDIIVFRQDEDQTGRQSRIIEQSVTKPLACPQRVRMRFESEMMARRSGLAQGQ